MALVKMKKFDLADLNFQEDFDLEKILGEEGVICLTGLDSAKIKEAYDIAIALFRLPDKERRRIWNMGYHLESDNPQIKKENDREVFSVNNHEGNSVEEIDVGLSESLDRVWDLFPELPNLRRTFGRMFEEWGDFFERHIVGCGQYGLDAFRYPPQPKGEFRVRAHRDGQYIISFKPRGEPLGVLLNGEVWFNEEIGDNEALMLRPGVMHRVKRVQGNERYSLMAYSNIFPI